jgi:hypothetical protein
MQRARLRGASWLSGFANALKRPQHFPHPYPQNDPEPAPGARSIRMLESVAPDRAALQHQ